MKYDITYSCGHNGRIDLGGRTKDREYYLRREAEKLCPECQAKQDEKDFEEVRKSWEEKGLPALTGTTKQILWADQIRNAAIEEAYKALEMLKRMIEKRPDRVRPDATEYVANFEKVKQFDLNEHKKASFWIESGMGMGHRMEKIWNERRLEVLPVGKQEDKRIAEPEKKKTESVAEISVIVNENGVSLLKVDSPKDNIIIDTVKGADFYWSSKRSAWSDRIDEKYASPEDAQAYIAAKLLDAGVAVKATESVILKAVSGDYQPKMLRFVFYNSTKDVFDIEFPYGSDCKETVRSMGARWDSDVWAYRLKGTEWRKVEDLAGLYGFGLYSSTKKHIEELKNSLITVPGAV